MVNVCVCVCVCVCIFQIGTRDVLSMTRTVSSLTIKHITLERVKGQYAGRTSVCILMCVFVYSCVCDHRSVFVCVYVCVCVQLCVCLSVCV